MQREFAQFAQLGDSWRSSSAAGTNFYALLGLVCAEVSRIAAAVALLLMTAFYLVQIVARLVECLLDAWIRKSSVPGVRMCSAGYKTMHLAVVAGLVWWTYYTFVTEPFFAFPGDFMVAQSVRFTKALSQLVMGLTRMLG